MTFSRLRGWPRWLALRRITALVLVLLAAALAVRPTRAKPVTVPMLVVARDLSPGTTLRAGDLAVSYLAPPLRPRAALTRPEQATGRVLAGAATAGEPLTTARLMGPENTLLATGDPLAAAVPFRLADPAVAGLLSPGARVDVVTVAPNGPDPVLLATNARVLTIRAAPEGASLVVIALPREEATRVAAAALDQPVAVTLR